MANPLAHHHDAFFKQFMSRPEFTDLFGDVPQALRPYLVSFRHALVDLATIEDRDLSAYIRLAAYLNAMKYAQRLDLPEHLRVMLAPELTDADMIAILHYINTGPVTVRLQLIQAALQFLGDDRREEIVGHSCPGRAIECGGGIRRVLRPTF